MHVARAHNSHVTWFVRFIFVRLFEHFKSHSHIMCGPFLSVGVQVDELDCRCENERMNKQACKQVYMCLCISMECLCWYDMHFGFVCSKLSFSPSQNRARYVQRFLFPYSLRAVPL